MDATVQHFDNNRHSWDLARRFFELSGIERYLKQARNEPAQAYKERKRDADVRPYTRDVLSRISGALMLRYGQSDRSHPGLDQDWFATAGDGGEDYSLVLSELATKLLLYNEAFLLIRPAGIDVLSPLQVPSYKFDGPNPGALVVGERETGSVTEGFESEAVYTHYKSGQWVMYDDDSSRIDAGNYSESGDAFEGPEGAPACPVVRVQMPWTTQLGVAVARAHAAIYRTEANRDSALRNSAFAILALDVGGDKETFKWMTSQLEESNVAIPQGQNVGHDFLVPDMKVAGALSEALEFKIEQLYKVTYNSLEGIRREQSASEATLNHQTGTGAALSVLSQTIQSAESSFLPLCAQSQEMSRSWESADAEWPSSWDQVEISFPDIEE